MNKSKNSLSKAISYKEIGDFWDTHDLTGFWDRTKSAKFEVDIHSEVTYYALDSKLSEKVRSIAGKKEYR
ncbi:MAG: BrnA antitoxin family protein [candidate division Zixibacteria bacterium]|nr:BrnA antitoxin family protein [candidate division Zixibacteria bacterium]